ncbi:MAG TPA: hypothetical protein PKY82_30140, partial [Pyrinomonadaceae bacterium]|nr:hypothetical protein [Pyrinomonadaceae bacterium]
MKVTSKYSIDDSIFIVNHLNKKNRIKQSRWVAFYSYFFYIYLFLLPAYLLFLNHFLAGFIIFLIIIIFFVFLRDKINNESLKDHYRKYDFGGEFREIEVELSENGIFCKYPAPTASIEEMTSFARWENIKEIVETIDKLYFFTPQSGITISKNSFESELQMQEFLIFA